MTKPSLFQRLFGRRPPEPAPRCPGPAAPPTSAETETRPKDERFDAAAVNDFLAMARENYAAITNPFSDFRRLTEGLDRAREDVDVVTLRTLAARRAPERTTIGLRIDIDADPRVGLRMARQLARVGVAGSAYLLHTAPYYGAIRDGRFLRNPALREWLDGFIVSGCEIGVHNDAFGAQVAGLDGAAALTEEITWLREQGAVISGTVAHNSAPAYGAANSEVFAERRLLTGPRDALDGVDLPLGALDETGLGLEYEGTFACPHGAPDREAALAFCRDRAGANLRDERWARRFLLENPVCRWDVDEQYWVIGRDEWVVAGHRDGAPIFRWMIGQDEAVRTMLSGPEGRRVLLVLHPEYFLG